MFKITRVLFRQKSFNLFLTNHRYTTATPAAKPVEQNEIQAKKNNLVAAAFASLNDANQRLDVETPFTDEKISKAQNVDDLLTISNGAGVSRRHALKVVSILAGWSANGKVQLADFESDPRFLKLCKVLTKSTSKVSKSHVSKHEDLATIMNVQADDEAAKLVTNITLAQMVKVTQTLAIKKRRSTSLLRALAFNIAKSSEKLDIKQSADLLYSLCMLNFVDENLLQKVCADVVGCLNETLKKSAVVGSIVTSLGLLKYNEINVLNAISEWMLKNKSIVRTQDVFGLFLTLAMLNYEPINSSELFKSFMSKLTKNEAQKSQEWLDFVWSLVTLNIASNSHLSSVLDKNFIQELDSENLLNIPAKLKLLNINAAATYLIKDYNECQLDSKFVEDAKELVTRSKEKEEFVTSVLDTMKNLVQTDQYLRSNVKTDMGFYIDAECVFDKKCNPVALSKFGSAPDLIKVAILTLDYHDMTRGRVQPSGISSLSTRLLESRGYKILQIPYHEYRSRDKLVQRVQYIENKLKTLIQT